MIRKIALEVFLGVLLLYFLMDLRGVLVDYDPLADVRGSVTSAARNFTDLPSGDYVRTGTKDIFEKNLFHPNRRGWVPAPKPKPSPVVAPPPPPPPPTVPPPVMPTLILKGILEDPSGEMIAVIELQGDRARSYRVGDVFDSFEVMEIGVLDVKLSWNGEPVEINLRNQPSTEVNVTTPGTRPRGRPPRPRR